MNDKIPLQYSYICHYENNYYARFNILYKYYDDIYTWYFWMANQNRYKTEIVRLLDNGQHRTADHIFKKLKKDYLFLGIGTVYRNLQELVDEWKIMKTSGILDKVIYEKAKPLHWHIVCHKSLMIFDVDISHLMIENNLIPENFNLQSINVIFDGHFWAWESGKCDGIASIMPKTTWLQPDPMDKQKMMAM